MITPDGPPGQDVVAEMTASGFQLARVQPLLGRPLIAEDERDGAEPVVVIGYDVWQSGFSSDPASPGTACTARRDVPYRRRCHACGVRVPRQSTYLDTAPNRSVGRSAGQAAREVFVFARLAPGVTLEGARAEVATVGMLPLDAVAGNNEHLQPRVVPYVSGVFTDVPDSGWVAASSCS